jgi:hypothetical protein
MESNSYLWQIDNATISMKISLLQLLDHSSAESQPEFVKHHVQPGPRVKPHPVEGDARYLPPTPK